MLSIWFLISLLFQNEKTDQDVVTERVTVEFVLLDVLAVNNKDVPVTDLTLSDFEVREGRKKVDITLFEKLDLRAASERDFTPTPIDTEKNLSKAGVTRRQVQQLVLAVDLFELPVTEAARTFDQLDKFVNSLDGAPTFSIDVRSLEYGSFTRGFTTNRRLVREALSEMRDRYLEGAVYTKEDKTLLGELTRRDPNRSGKPGRRSGTLAELEYELRNCTGVSVPEMCMKPLIRDFLERHYMRSLRVLGEMTAMAEGFKQDGLKTILLVSPGFSSDNLDSVFQLKDHILRSIGIKHVEDQYVNAPTMGNRTGGLFNSPEMKARKREFTDACLQNRVTVHAFDIYNGFEQQKRTTSSEYHGASQTTRDIYNNFNNQISTGLLKAAGDTGGSFTQSFGLTTPMTKAVDRGRYYYLFGYTSPDGKKGRWRNLKVKCKRKGVRLQYRAGYYSK